MIDLRLGDCLGVMGSIPDGSIDAIICDPPYHEIDRDYGRMTEPEWHEMMRGVVAESRRILKPTGSAVFVLQPNSERVGRMRPWLWEFMAWTAREWNQVQDAWWWNVTAMPHTGCDRKRGLMRPSVKACIWLGAEDCYRNQDSVLWLETDHNKAMRQASRALRYSPSGAHVNNNRMGMVAIERGGVTPFNLLPIANADSRSSAGATGHGAGTPRELCDWWVRYICPPGGTICDPFMGTGTTGLSALKYGCSYIGIEKMVKYFKVAQARIAQASEQPCLALA